jgi:CRISPR-associated endonuclease/helicase Cas3
MSAFPDFPSFFHTLWGYDPFPWQSMLAERVARGAWPSALDLPTASGKTACIEIALYALAAQADLPTAKRTAPRRIWFVVDRRIVVDEAYERANRIAQKLRKAKHGPLSEVAERLRAIAETERPLAVARLRGGVFRDDNWARLPSQPAVITSTVDQLGSRLLFRGYGRRSLTAPIFAGLAANDSLILLDEAHCSVPFMQTLQAVEQFRGDRWAEEPVPAPFAFAILSATPPRDVAEDRTFPGHEREAALDHPVLAERLNASKPAALVKVGTRRAASADPLIGAAVKQAGAYVADDKRRVAVMVNRVHTAQAIASAVRAKIGDAADVVLLTGRLRPFERDQLVERWSPVLRAASPDSPARPIVLVSTQCLEVGADFSFDALVTECASLDALRQRFGRLNRMGDSGTPPAAVLIRDRDADPAKAEPDPIYGSAIGTTWQILNEYAKDNVIDFGFESLRATLEGVGDLSAFLAPTSDAPVLLPAHMDLLCQTAPVPEPEPDVQLFLHGKDRGAPEVQVVWRADLDVNRRDIWKECVALCPPLSGEMLSVPIYRLRAFLAEADQQDDSGDVEGVPEGNADGRPSAKRHFLVWRGRDQSVVTRNPRRIDPGDVVVIPASYGIGSLGQTPVEPGLGAERIDLWERVTHATPGRETAVRLNVSILALWGSCPPVQELLRVAGQPERDRAAINDAIDAVLNYERADADDATAPPEWLRAILQAVRTGRRSEEHPAGGIVRFGPRKRRASAERDLFADDDDLTSASHRDVSLDEHSDLVEHTAERLTRLCLPAEYLPIIPLAAHWHDVGKLDERFQLVLRQGDELALYTADAPLAKSRSITASPERRRQIRASSGLPDYFRHEMLSVQLAEHIAPLPEDQHATDLFLHLLASHHGHGRPFAPVCLDEAPPAVEGKRAETVITLDAAERAAIPPPHRIDSGIPDRFWRLVRRHGWWGLAYLEAILRLSDWYASEYVKAEDESQQTEAVA